MLRAYSGTEALLLLKDSRPDLVPLDLMLPGLPGEEVLPQLQGISVIVVSVKTAVQDKVGLLLGGAADYLTKPFDTKELLARVAVRLRDATGKDHIEAVWGIGFRLRPEWAARCLFGILLLVNGLVFWKRVLPVYKRSFSA